MYPVEMFYLTGLCYSDLWRGSQQQIGGIISYGCFKKGLKIWGTNSSTEYWVNMVAGRGQLPLDIVLYTPQPSIQLECDS